MGRPRLTDQQRINGFLSRIKKTDYCWNWEGTLNWLGYGMAWNGEKWEKAHRYSFKLFKQEIPVNKLVLHSCNNKKCVNPNHLRIGTHKDNFNDSLKAGTAAVCQNNSQAKLTKEQVLKIKEMYVPWKFGCLKLARMFNVSRRNITRIVSGEAWRYVNYV